VLAELALQPLGIGLLQAFHRFGGSRGRILLRGGRVNGLRLLCGFVSGVPPPIPAVVFCAAASKAKNAFEAKMESAQAQTRVTIRIFKVIPVLADG
jgi:hypothetical protein